MAGKLTLLVGFGAGYVLGARSGRERYEQIAAKAQQVWNDPRVQEKTGQAQQLVQEKAAQAGQAVKSKVTSEGAEQDPGSPSSAATGTAIGTADVSGVTAGSDSTAGTSGSTGGGKLP